MNAKKLEISKENLVPKKDYLFLADRSGNANLKSVADSRVYVNPAVNGTTAFILAALSTVSTEKRIFSPAELAEGKQNLSPAKREKSEAWKRLISVWERVNGNAPNRSKDPAKKYGSPLVSSLIATGAIRGIDPEGISTPEVRKLLGFDF